MLGIPEWLLLFRVLLNLSAVFFSLKIYFRVKYSGTLFFVAGAVNDSLLSLLLLLGKLGNGSFEADCFRTISSLFFVLGIYFIWLPVSKVTLSKLGN